MGVIQWLHPHLGRVLCSRCPGDAVLGRRPKCPCKVSLACQAQGEQTQFSRQGCPVGHPQSDPSSKSASDKLGIPTCGCLALQADQTRSPSKTYVHIEAPYVGFQTSGDITGMSAHEGRSGMPPFELHGYFGLPARTLRRTQRFRVSLKGSVI